MPDLKYSYAKIGEATQVLAVHPARIKDRLTQAATHLVMVDPNVFKQPGIYVEAAVFWDKIWSTITSKAKIDDSIDALDESEASEIAQRIVSLEAMLFSAVYEK